MAVNSPSASAKVPTSLAFVGGGKMAEAIIAGMSKSSDAGISQIDMCAVDPVESRRELLSSKYGIKTYESVRQAGSAIYDSTLLILAVKPQTIPAVFEQLRSLETDAATSADATATERQPPKYTPVSIVAGLSMDGIRKGLNAKAVCRSMPNTNATIGEGMVVWCCDASAEDDTVSLIRTLFESCGEAERVDDEDVLDIATAISGSGPAYFLYVMESMVESGVHMGLPRDLASRLVKQTMLGTAHYAQESGQSPTSLRHDITSPGGTTSEALFVSWLSLVFGV